MNGKRKRDRTDEHGPNGDENGRNESFASPPCLMHEFEESYMGYLGHPEIVTLLNELLEGERAGAKVLGLMAREVPDPEIERLLREVGRDEGNFCAMLRDHIKRFGGEPSDRVGAFYDKIVAIEQPSDRIDMLNRGQGWVVRKLREALPKIRDEKLHADLEVMREVHVRNIERCDKVAL